VITTTTIFINSYFLLVGPLYVNLAIDKGINEFWVGVIVAAFPISGIFSTFLAPSLSFIFGRKRYAVFCIVLCVLTGLLMGYLNEIEDPQTFFYLSLFARIFHGHADYTYCIISASFILTLYKDDPDIGFVFSFLRTGNLLGYAMGPLFGALLFQYIGYSMSYYCFSIFFLVISLIIHFSVRDEQKIDKTYQE
jgi:MFS family permease